MPRSKTIASLALLVMAAVSSAAINIRLQAYPYEVVADSRSSISISIEARNNDGSVVADGTKILLTTTLGTFREQIVSVTGGRAQAILIAGNIPGTAKITASELNNQSNPSTIEVEFVSSREKLSSSSDYIEINVPNRFEYHFETRIITGAGSKQNITGIFRETNFKCDDVQLLQDSGELRAKNATFKIKDKTYNFSELYLDTKTGRGYGVTPIDYLPISKLTYSHGLITAYMGDEESGYERSKPRKRIAVVEISPTGVRPVTVAVSPETFDFKKTRKTNIATTKEELKLEDPNDLQTGYLTATRFSIVLRRELQFQNVQVYQGEQKVWSQALMSFSAGGFQGQYPMQQYFTITDSQFGVNYPFFLNLGRESTSAIRFRTGQSYGRGFNVNRGVFFDYESNWNRRDNSVGNLVLSGVGRDDYNIGLRQTLRLDNQTTANISLDSPQLKSMINNVSLSRQQSDFQLSLISSQQRTFTGPKSDRTDYLMIAERNPIKIRKLPIQMFYGINAAYGESKTDTDSTSTTGVGGRLRFQSDPIRINNSSTLASGLTLGQFSGSAGTQVNTNFNISFSKSMKNSFNTTWFYEYNKDGQTEQSLGAHRMSNNLFYRRGRLDLSLLTQKSLDADRLSLFGQFDYQFASLWKTGLTYTLNRYANDTFVDYNLILAYRIAQDKPFFGLAYSKETNRIGFVILNGLR
jgi:hypothetical protein